MALETKFALHEVMSILEDDDEFYAADIVMIPPKDPNCSDEDSLPEDGEGTIDNLTRNQLSAEAEVILSKIGKEKVFLCEANENVKKQPRKKAKFINHRWVKKDIIKNSNQETFKGENSNFENMTPLLIFNLFLDSDVIRLITDMSNLYASQKLKQLNATENEYQVVLAILLLSGYVPLVNHRMYWEQSDDVHNSAVSKAMSLDRFEELLRYLHCNDNEKINNEDKMAKVRPMFDAMNDRFFKFWPKESHLAIDESVIPCYGRLSSKQFIKGKPIRFGYKVRCLNNRLGYLINCDPYQGASEVFNGELGVGGSVVSKLINCLPREYPFHLYFDDYFTSFKLIEFLKNNNIYATGTVRSNRIEKCPIEDSDKMKQKPRGEVDFLLDEESNIIVVRWNDNSVVTLLSSDHGVEPMKEVKRWSSAKKKHLYIPQPELMSQYSYYMGGTDQMDKNIENMRINIKIKKWWWPLFCFLIDASIHNAWCIYKKYNKTQEYSCVQFRRQVVKAIMGQINVKKERNEISQAQNVVTEVRYDGKDHFIGRIEDGQKRCRQCGKKVQKKCLKCNVALHIDCFNVYHKV